MTYSLDSNDNPMCAEILIVLQTAWRVGKDGIEAGTSMVPVSRVCVNLSVTLSMMILGDHVYPFTELHILLLFDVRMPFQDQ